MPHMMFEGHEFTPRGSAPPLSGGDVFRFCQFDDIDIEGVSYSGVMEGCTFTRGRFYWGLLNVASLIDVRFVDCIFPGTSFRGCRLVQCAFENCRFVLDNLGGSATIDDCSFTECSFERCIFQRAPQDSGDVITPRNRLYACRISKCEGLTAR
jgi:uncharacterized protein YjbI with pentapeptide repeats